jgi:hypothetical protein
MFLKTFANLMVSSQPFQLSDTHIPVTISDFINIAGEFLNRVLDMALALLGFYAIVLGVLLGINAATMGITQLVQTILFSFVRGIILSLLFGTILGDIVENSLSLAQGKEKAEELIPTMFDFFKIGVGFTGMLVEIFKVYEEHMENVRKGKPKILSFYVGLTLAIGGYFIDAATTFFDLKGEVLKWADIGGIIVSLSGLLIMMWESRAPEKKATDTLAPILSIIEWIVGIGGVIAAVMTFAADAREGWDGR